MLCHAVESTIPRRSTSVSPHGHMAHKSGGGVQMRSSDVAEEYFSKSTAITRKRG